MIGKITKFKLINSLIHINIFFIVGICYQLANKTRNLLFGIQLHTYFRHLW
jgi:hypothetical protein